MLHFTLMSQTIQTAGGKQIILQKSGAGGAGGQPQIVTLVKTSQGMTVATVPKGMSLVQAKPGTTGGVTTVQGSPKGLPQGATIVKLVGQGQAGTKGTTTLLQAGTQVPAGTLMTVGGKQQMVTTQNVGGKQTIVITRPGGQGTAIKQQGVLTTILRRDFHSVIPILF